MGTTTATDIGQQTDRNPAISASPSAVLAGRWRAPHLCILLTLWLAIFTSALAGPTLLDDADATHAQAAQAMLSTGDWVTLHVDGIRYLEKPPLPYWIAAVSLRLFSAHPAFAIHLPLALTILGLALLGYAWSRRAFNETAALLTAIFLLTSAGTFLFTRVFIPDALLSLLLAFALYLFQRILDDTQTTKLSSRPKSAQFADAVERSASQTATALAMWATLALATLTKGLIAPVFFLATVALYLAITKQLSRWRELRPFTGTLLFLAIAAPWHILAGLRNTGSLGGFGFAPGHGFFWFYFVNEHLLRFLGQRLPRDYNKLPFALYWSLHLVWLFPWSLFAPAAIFTAWRRRTELLAPARASRTILLLGIFSALVLCFFSLSTNQEYYTFPVYLPLLMLLAAALSPRTTNLGAPCPAAGTWAESPQTSTSATTFAFAAYTVLGLLITTALTVGLWSSRALPYNPDIGSALAHRGVGDYTLSMSHFFDLTDTSFAALRLPAILAALAFLVGPSLAWLLHTRRKELAAMLTIAATSAVFFVAAHLALLRFAPMLSSASFAQTIESLEATHRIAPGSQILLFGDQAYGSSIPFYLHRHVSLVDGRTTSMLFGSTFPDAPSLFLTHQQLLAAWGTGPRKILFVPLELRDQVDHLLGSRKILITEASGKALFTDRPLDPTSSMKDLQ
ncbi:ArnT family glycosyltransferase [Granulicella paludicola]|uniref:ArnT family glycosyltransferase n=1 Tax=Granulicella paludicola TaxID=474951 RepID=UPI0021E042C1|nr:glycosyltransferase family 39 protein [Granulicella paludicola]